MLRNHDHRQHGSRWVSCVRSSNPRLRPVGKEVGVVEFVSQSDSSACAGTVERTTLFANSAPADEGWARGANPSRRAEPSDQVCWCFRDSADAKLEDTRLLRTIPHSVSRGFRAIALLIMGAVGWDQRRFAAPAHRIFKRLLDGGPALEASWSHPTLKWAMALAVAFTPLANPPAGQDTSPSLPGDRPTTCSSEGPPDPRGPRLGGVREQWKVVVKFRRFSWSARSSAG